MTDQKTRRKQANFGQNPWVTKTQLTLVKIPQVTKNQPGTYISA